MSQPVVFADPLRCRGAGQPDLVRALPVGSTQFGRHLFHDHFWFVSSVWMYLIPQTEQAAVPKPPQYAVVSNDGGFRSLAPIQHSLSTIIGYLANVRSLRQAVGDIRKAIPAMDADIFFFTENSISYS